LEAGLRADYWVRAMALCANSSAVTPAVVEAFFAGLQAHAERLAGNPNTYFSAKSNWGVMEFTGLYLLGWVLHRPDYVAQATACLKRQLATQLMGDGFQWEGSTMYHNEVLMSFLEVLRIAALWGDAPFTPAETEQIRGAALATLYSQTPAGHQPMTGDSDDTDVRDLLAQAALLLQDGTLKAGAFSELDYEGLWLFGTKGRDAYRSLPAKAPAAEIKTFPCAGQVFYRSAWGPDADWLHLRTGPLGGGHGHQDRLHLDLWLDGEEVLTDSGRYTYQDVPLRYQLKGAAAHNVPVINGREAVLSRDSWLYKALPPALGSTVTEVGDSFLLEGLHTGYAGAGMLLRRRVLAIRHTIFVICDEVLGPVPETLHQYFHFAENIALQTEGNRLNGQGKRTGFCMQAYAGGQPLPLQTEKTCLSRHYNQLSSASRAVICAPGSRAVTTILVRCGNGQPVHIAPQTVCNKAYHTTLTPQQGEGYLVEIGNQRQAIVLLHQDVGNDTDFNGFEGVYGLGQVMTCDLAQHPQAMTVLQW
ncbi:MAG: alginate lyase family protein, partial [Gemmiger sp.]|nr:alginate lyase family protein [Gemmiger sp.]